MGVRPDYPYQGNKAQRYQQCGNGVVPVVAQRLAEAVMRADQ
jgi:site-specific DNA-cytosine methylase